MGNFYPNVPQALKTQNAYRKKNPQNCIILANFVNGTPMYQFPKQENMENYLYSSTITHYATCLHIKQVLPILPSIREI
jgi:hypothetical protein